MQSGKGLLAGIDISNKYCMASYFDYDEKKVKSVIFADNRPVADNPYEFKKLPDLFKEGSVRESDNAVGHVSKIIEYIKKISGISYIEKICFTLKDFYMDNLCAISMIMKRLGIDDDKWSVISHDESFALYAYSQKKELYSASVLLLDYGENGIDAILLNKTKAASLNKDIVMENTYDISNESVSAAFTGAIFLDEASDCIIEWLSDIFSKYSVSSLYLTGEGFNCESYPDRLTKFLCMRRKVFAGQNLFVKGAVYYCLKDSDKESLNNLLLACKNRVTTGIEVQITDRGIVKRLRIIKPGVNWYMAYRKMDFILDDINKITLIMKPCNDSAEYTEEIDISEIPYRKGKMTRISMEIAFVSDSRCVVTVTDKGFGQFVKSSGTVIVKEIDI
ncbi:MAG: DUF5716 family protein [Lachnospira sp.]